MRRLRRACRRSVERGERTPNALLALAGAIVAPIQRSLANAIGLPWQEEIRNRLGEAEELVTQAIDAVADQDDGALRREALQNRVAIRVLRTDPEGARRDIDSMLTADATDSAALSALGALLLREGRPGEAIEVLEAVTGEETQHNQIPLAHAYVQANRPQDAIQLLVPIRDAPSDKSVQLIYADLLCEAYEAISDDDSIKRVLDELAKTFPDDPRAIAVHARHLGRVSRYEEAAQYFQQAFDRASGPARARIALEFAQLLNQAGRYADAIPFYELSADTSSENETSRAYLLALYNAGELGAARDLCLSLREAGSISWAVLQVEVAILSYTGDLSAAIELLKEEGGDGVLQRLELAELHYRNGGTEDAAEVVDGIAHELMWDDPDLLVRVGQLRSLLNLGGVLPIALT